MGSAALFASRFQKNAQRVKERLAAYMEEPENEEKVHDVRTGLRRLDASFILMPKKLRERNRQQIDAHKQFFRANSRVRDYDIIQDGIVACAHGDPLARLVADLDKKRKVEVAGAVGLARLVSTLPPASLKELDDEELESRMDEVAGKLVKKVKKRFPVVVANRKAVEELHRLRKDLKKLRYVLEMMPAGVKKPYEEKMSRIMKGKRKRATERLEELQDALGAIHDVDITVQYLAGLEHKIAAPIIRSKKVERDELFSQFVKSVRS